MRVLGELSPDGVLYTPYPPPDGKAHSSSAYSLRAFEDHYADAPSTDDLRTLVHARVVFADGGLGEQFEAVRQVILSRERQSYALSASLSALRPKRGEGPWDVIGAPGGLTDIELLVEHLCLTAAATARDPGIVADGLIGTLEAGAEHGLIDATAAAELAGATRLWQNFDGFMRMAAVEQDPTLLSPEEQSTLAQACDAVAFGELARSLAATRQRSKAHIDTWFSTHLRRAGTDD